MVQAVSRRSLTADPGFDPWSVHVGFVVGKVVLGQVFPRVLRFSLVSFIPPVLHYLEKRKKIIIFSTGLHNKPQDCGASVASAAGPFTKRKHTRSVNFFFYDACARAQIKLRNKYFLPNSSSYQIRL
jgi:hypothetical protein